MRSKRYSLYLALALIIFTIIALVMTINATYIYNKTKNKTIEHMKTNSSATILSLKDSTKKYIASYAVNEYDNLISNEISRRDIFAIIIEDYNMGKILGKKALITGKIKYSNEKIVDYIPDNIKQNEQLDTCFYTKTYEIKNGSTTLGVISIYISDKKMQQELNEIIIDTIKNSIVLSLILILSLLLTIKLFILNPIFNIINTISRSDKDGIPLETLPNNKIIEINHLSTSINKMIHSIKKSRNILRKEQNRLESILNLSPIAIRVAKDNGENLLFLNKAYTELLHLKKNETKINPKDYYTNSEDYEEVLRKLKTGEPIYNKLLQLDVEDKKIWVLGSYMNIDFDGEDAILAWFYDVTKEKETEVKLYEALELQTTIFDNTGYMIIRCDKEGIIKQFNKEAEKVLGYTQEEVIDKHTPNIFHLKSEMEYRAKELIKEFNTIIYSDFEVFITEAKKGIKSEHEWTYITKDGEHIPIILSVTALKDKKNQIYGYLGIARDISERKLIESQTKLASMGEMIGNIAHQWRQPLSVISTVASSVTVKQELEILKEDELIDNMKTISKQTEYLSKTIDDFRNFIKNKDEKESILISEVVKKAITLLNSTFKNNSIKVILNVEYDVSIKAYENQLIQALINIINNSKDAIKEHTDSHERYIFISTKNENGNLLLTIKDNGGGINHDIIDKIFDPYFTTKHKSIGTGIGLSMTHQIITKHHNAQIKVFNISYKYEEKMHRGACFEIVFKQ